VLLLSGCAAAIGDTATVAATTAAADTSTNQQARVAPGVTGEIAALADLTFQLQASDSQTAVTYTAETTFSSTLAATLADVTVGACVNVSSSAAADGTDAAPIATTVVVTDAVDGTCASGIGALGGGVGGGGVGSGGAGGGAGGGGAGGGTPPTDLPSGAERTAPSGLPTDVPADAAGSGSRTSGVVTAVTATTITMESTDPAETVSSDVVTVADATSYSKTSAVDASAIAVGLCATAQGEADDSGSFAATAVALSAAGNEGCVSAPAGAGDRVRGAANE